MSRSVDGKSFLNIGAGTTAAFNLRGGRYAMEVVGTGFGTVELQVQGADGATFISLYQPFNNAGTEVDLVIGKFAANGQKFFQLMAGTYQIVVTTASAVYVNIRRIQGE
jgi:hypothetical protein